MPVLIQHTKQLWDTLFLNSHCACKESAAPRVKQSKDKDGDYQS